MERGSFLFRDSSLCPHPPLWSWTEHKSRTPQLKLPVAFFAPGGNVPAPISPELIGADVGRGR